MIIRDKGTGSFFFIANNLFNLKGKKLLFLDTTHSLVFANNMWALGTQIFFIGSKDKKLKSPSLFCTSTPPHPTPYYHTLHQCFLSKNWSSSQRHLFFFLLLLLLLLQTLLVSKLLLLKHSSSSGPWRLSQPLSHPPPSRIWRLACGFEGSSGWQAHGCWWRRKLELWRKQRERKEG